MNQQRFSTAGYFDAVAGKWRQAAYDPDGTYLRYPTGRVRSQIAIREIEADSGGLNQNVRIADLACGSGDLVLDLRRRGADARGVDIAEGMITEARAALNSEFPEEDAASIFEVGDLETWRADVDGGQFDYVCAMGVMEYLEDDRPLMDAASRLLRPGGQLYVQCRNRLFNLSSANDYLLRDAQKGSLEEMLSDLEHVAAFSPLADGEGVALAIERFTSTIQESPRPKPPENNDKLQAVMPERTMRRRQHTPRQLAASAKRAGLDCQYVIYYRLHPAPPMFRELSPALYNWLSMAMQPIGYTPLGSTIGSSFVACLSKPGTRIG